MKLKNIQTRLLAFLAPLFIISFAILSMVSYYLSEKDISNANRETGKAIASGYAYRIEGQINELLNHIITLSADQQVRTGENKDRIVEAMAALHKRAGVFDAVDFAWPDGSAVRWNGQAANYGDRDYFKKALETKKPCVSDVVISQTNGSMIIFLAVPVIYNEKLNGVLAATYNLERLSEILKTIKFEDTGSGYLADSNGMLISNPKLPETVGKLNIKEKKIHPELKFKNAELDDNIIKLFKEASSSRDKQAYGSFVFVDGVARSGVFTPVSLAGGQRWMLIVSAPTEEVRSEINVLATSMIAVSSVIIILAGIFLIIVSRRFARPIAEIRDQFLFLAGGDLTEREFKIASDDETGRLTECFASIREGLRQLIMKIRTQAEQLSASSRELTAASQSCAENVAATGEIVAGITADTDKQTATLRQIFLAVEDVSQNTRQVSSAVEKAAGITVNVSQEAAQGRHSTEKAVGQMKQIGESSAAVQAAIGELAKVSSKISEIVGLISSIAGQTNLLALNAAIEAEKAGEHGRGFAIVAGEVLKLAESSNLAAQQICNLIVQNQKNIEEAAAASKIGEEGIRAGVEAVNNAGEIFAKIVAEITSLTDQVQEMSASVEQLADFNNNLNQSIGEISDITGHSAAEVQKVSSEVAEQVKSVKEIADASRELAEIAVGLQAATSKFIV